MKSTRYYEDADGEPIVLDDPVQIPLGKHGVAVPTGRYKSSHNDSDKSRPRVKRPTDPASHRHHLVYDAGRGHGTMQLKEDQ